MWYVRPAKSQIRLTYAQSGQSVKLLTEQHKRFLSVKGGCTGSSELIHVKMPHCWKSHVAVLHLISTLLKNYQEGHFSRQTGQVLRCELTQFVI